jgi:AraC-like DNA-binding protein
MTRKQHRAWLDLLRSPDAPIEVPLYAHHTVSPDWDSEQPGLREHLLYLVAQHACEGNLAGRVVRLDSGALLWLRPGVPFRFRLAQAARPIELYRFRLFIGNGSCRAGKVTGRVPFEEPFAVWRKAWEARPVFESLLVELHTRRAYREERLRALLVLFFSTLFRLGEEQQGERSGLRGSVCERLQRLVASSPDRRLTPLDLATEAGLSLDYFTRLFRRTYGVAPRKWLVRERLRWAAQRLVESDVTIGALAAQLGYPDIFSFSRQFKQVHGISPRAHRRQGRSEGGGV